MRSKPSLKTVQSTVGKLSGYAYRQTRALLPSATKRQNEGKECALIVASAHKVGSTWFYRMIRSLYLFREWPVPSKYRSDSRNPALLGLSKPGVEKYLAELGGFRLFKTHCKPPGWICDRPVKFVNVVRDPRDVVISNIFYLANLGKTSPQLGGWSDFNDMTLSERISSYLDRASFDLELLEQWSSYDRAETVYYEKLLQAPQQEMVHLFQKLGITVADAEFQRMVAENTFVKLSGGRGSGKEDTNSFFRKGVSGDWRNYFGQEETELYKSAMAGRWNKVLVKLGYERSECW